MTRVTVLIENERGAPGLTAQWGLSLWIETDRARVLLDSGLNAAFRRNARALGVPLAEADAFILTHGHADHGGGVAAAVELAPAATVVLHPAALAPRYLLRRTGKVDQIGLPDSALASLRSAGGRVVYALRPTRVAPGVWASGPVPRREPLEGSEPSFFLDPACTVPDHVVDDQALWVESAAGLVVLVGCAHAGVINTLGYVRRAAGAAAAQTGAAVPLAADGLPRVRAVVGGMHLLQAPRARLRATADALLGAGVEALAPVHCTGKRGKAYLRERLPAACVECVTGSILEID